MTKRLVFIGIVLVSVVLMVAFVCYAGPFLVCDPQAGVTSYELEIDGAVVASNISAEADGSVRYDMAGTANGSYNLRLRCSNPWGVSEWSDPLAVIVQVCGPPENLSIQP